MNTTNKQSKKASAAADKPAQRWVKLSPERVRELEMLARSKQAVPVDWQALAISRYDWAISLECQRNELVEALRGLFDHCAMVHKHWGEGCNQREADAAIARASAVIARAEVRQ